jgi:transposase
VTVLSAHHDLKRVQRLFICGSEEARRPESTMTTNLQPSMEANEANHLGVVVGGVDTHLDVHVAAVLGHTGVLLDTAEFAATPKGYTHLLDWMNSFGALEAVGVEGSGNYGAGLTRFLLTEGVRVVEVVRPDRRARRFNGKSDTLDA